jgi:hypothetical protein
LRELALEYDVLDVAYDPDHFARSAELLIQEGLPMTEMFQSPKRLTQATATFWRLISGRPHVPSCSTSSCSPTRAGRRERRHREVPSASGRDGLW